MDDAPAAMSLGSSVIGVRRVRDRVRSPCFPGAPPPPRTGNSRSGSSIPPPRRFPCALSKPKRSKKRIADPGRSGGGRDRRHRGRQIPLSRANRRYRGGDAVNTRLLARRCSRPDLALRLPEADSAGAEAGPPGAVDGGRAIVRRRPRVGGDGAAAGADRLRVPRARPHDRAAGQRRRSRREGPAARRDRPDRAPTRRAGRRGRSLERPGATGERRRRRGAAEGAHEIQCDDAGAIDAAQQAQTSAQANVRQRASRARQSQRAARLRGPPIGLRRRGDVDGAEVGQTVSPGQSVVDVAEPDLRDAVIDVPDALVGALEPGAVSRWRCSSILAIEAPRRRPRDRARVRRATRTRRVKIGARQSARRPSASVRRSRRSSPPAPRRCSGCRAPRARRRRPRRRLDRRSEVADGLASRQSKSERAATMSSKSRAVLAPAMRVVTAGSHSLVEGQSVKIDEGSTVKPFNLSNWALEHRSLVWYFMIVFAIAGVFSYLEPRARGRPRLHDQDHDHSGAMARRLGRGRDPSGHRPDREEARGAGIARLHPQRHDRRPDHRFRQYPTDDQGQGRAADLGARAQHDRRHPDRRFRRRRRTRFQRSFRRRLRQHLRLHRRRPDGAPVARPRRICARESADRAQCRPGADSSARRTRRSISTSRPGRSPRSASTAGDQRQPTRAERHLTFRRRSGRARADRRPGRRAVRFRGEPEGDQPSGQRPLLSLDRRRDHPARPGRSAALAVSFQRQAGDRRSRSA